MSISLSPERCRQRRTLEVVNTASDTTSVRERFNDDKGHSAPFTMTDKSDFEHWWWSSATG